MKKKLLIALFVIAAIVCMFASCGECEHAEYEVKSTVKATCTAEGKTIEACKECGAEKITPIKKIDHTYKWEDQAVSCVQEGKRIGTCTVCGFIQEKDIVAIDKNAHQLEEKVITAPTCTVNGRKGMVCKFCGIEKNNITYDTNIPALGHTYERLGSGYVPNEQVGISFVPGDCENNGYISRICQDCGTTDHITMEEYAELGTEDFDSQIYDQMPAWGHNYNETVATPIEEHEATCTTGGYKVFACTNPGCDIPLNLPTSEPLGHAYVKDETAVEGTHYVITLDSTCIATGTKAYICTRCGETATDSENIDVIPVKEHNFVDDETICQLLESKDATCTTAAYKIFKCNGDKLCEETKTFTYGKELGHDWKQNGDPTCATEGLTPWKCERCGIEETREDEFANLDIRHTFGSVDTAATCCDRAIFKCSVCEKTYTSYDDDVSGDPTNAHVYDVFVETVDPTCSAEGYNTYSCSAGNCGTTQDREYTRRTNHDFNPVTEDGKIVCVVCAAEYRDVSTEVTTGGGDLCLGCEQEECTCGLKVEWNGYVSPKGPESITANELYTKSEVVWTEVEQSTKPLAIGEGMVVLNGAEETAYTVVVYDSNGDALATYEVSGEFAFVDLYKHEDVAKVEITATTDAEVYFYAIIK